MTKIMMAGPIILQPTYSIIFWICMPLIAFGWLGRGINYSGCFFCQRRANRSGSGQCQYTSEGITSGCVKVSMPNPDSYGYLKCSEITDAEVCLDENYSCQPLYENASDDISGSWVITKDYPTVDPASGRTGCCFGKCKSNQ